MVALLCLLYVCLWILLVSSQTSTKDENLEVERQELHAETIHFIEIQPRRLERMPSFCGLRSVAHLIPLLFGSVQYRAYMQCSDDHKIMRILVYSVHCRGFSYL